MNKKLLNDIEKGLKMFTLNSGVSYYKSKGGLRYFKNTGWREIEITSDEFNEALELFKKDNEKTLLKHSFTCESKRDINGLIEDWRDWFESYHKGFIVNIIDVTFKHLEIGLIEVTITYDV
jgi:hypothetical protein